MLQQILLLSEIAQLGTASAIKPAMIMRLQHLTEDYVMCGAALFQDTAMKPTHHYLLGYLFLILQFGPLIKMWTIFVDQSVQQIAKTKNLTLKLPQHHQLFQAYKNRTKLTHTKNTIKKHKKQNQE